MTAPVDAPDSALARQARELLNDSCTPAVVGHSERSFQFAALLARSEATEVDLEVLYVGTLLHDVGLSPRFDGPARFEMRGANAGRATLLDAGMGRCAGRLGAAPLEPDRESTRLNSSHPSISYAVFCF